MPISRRSLLKSALPETSGRAFKDKHMTKYVIRRVKEKKLRIDFGIPRPEPRGTWSRFIEEMDPKKNASVHFADKSQAIAFITLLTKNGYKGTMSKGHKGYRVWRVK